MIKFFRRIRQKLLTENKFSKYLLYAIGEIILVVIGILIALSINNWNEGNKIKAKEREILLHMKRNLESNLQQYYPKQVIENALKANNVILEHLEQAKPYTDSLDYYFGWIPAYTRYMPNTTAYENLKSIGFDIISNDTLRENYQNLFAFNYSLIEFQRNELAYNNAIVFKEFYKKHFRNFIWQKNATPIDYQALTKNNEFHEMLLTTRRENTEQMRLRDLTNVEIEKLIQMINRELHEP
ncbi:DUF6090 family protein [Maribacter sp. PR1]|uniref:DUF6090 family protein n=1 Tax=Maribacter cobaltidurans TaxID=1178778 RepID=A0ABU7IPK7_9FLAO|nr:MULTISPECIES: DUF6090 family protein [Maribacter]MDC6387416.1 DUF6090 family protein [Maribacter sp. PR1]MEE1974803.1 DUF6090 family protein [Maribacter cobaltidurans]